MLIYLIMSIVTVFILFMYFKAHHDILDYRSIVDQRLPEIFDDYSVFYISDIHRRKINPKTINAIKRKINIVVIGGDLTEKGVPLERTRQNLRLLKIFDAPIYFIWGNNDYEIKPTRLNQLLQDENIIILKDSYINISRNEYTLNVIGFDYHAEEEIRPEIDWSKMNGNYRLLLTHVPNSFYELNPHVQNSIHTVLAGHTHGGQIRIFGFGFYQRGGLHVSGQTNIFISEGYGYTFLPLRLQTNAECHVLTLKNKNNAG